MLEARSLQTSCQQACAPAQGCRKESFLLSSELPMIPSNPRYALGCRRITLTFASTFAWFLLTFFLVYNLLSVAVMKTLNESYVREKGLFGLQVTAQKRVCSAYRLQPTTTGSRCRSSRREPRGGK